VGTRNVTGCCFLFFFFQCNDHDKVLDQMLNCFCNKPATVPTLAEGEPIAKFTDMVTVEIRSLLVLSFTE